MARRQSHILHFSRIVGYDHMSAGIWIVFDPVDELGDLIDTAEISPLFPVYRSEISVFRRKGFIVSDLLDKLLAADNED